MPTRPDAGAVAATGPAEPDLASLWTRAADHMGVRSRFFDDYFRAACGEGVRQAVILAAGLDTRAFRLDWPARTRVFELDQPRVLEFKDTVLHATGAAARCDRRVVPVDLREEWARPLRDTGFDPAAPTAWLAEGLLPYLLEHAQRDMMTTIAREPAAGSRVAVEYVRNVRAIFDDPAMIDLSARFGIDMAALIPDSARRTTCRPTRGCATAGRWPPATRQWPSPPGTAAPSSRWATG